MSDAEHLAYLVGRQVAAAVNGSATGSTVNQAAAIPACAAENQFDGRIGLRVSAIFVILAGSLLGTCGRPIRPRNITVTATNSPSKALYYQSMRTGIKASEYRNGHFS